MVLVSETLSRAGFKHGFSTREAGDFAILRDPARLAEYQARLAEAVGFERARLFQTKQVHGKAVVVVGRSDDAKAVIEREADALVAEAGSDAAVAVRVADCVPILLADPKSGRVAAVHAGWRGVVARVIEAAIERMGGASVAAIGPSIGPCCFEVGVDVAETIAGATDAGVIARRAGEKAYVDLRRGVRVQLRALGLADDAIEDVPGCTRCDAVRFHSFRRDGDASGRLVGVIVAR